MNTASSSPKVSDDASCLPNLSTTSTLTSRTIGCSICASFPGASTATNTTPKWSDSERKCPACGGNCGKPALLDLFSGAGGAARGYQLAGFCVLGIDVKPQPHYAGCRFHQADALEYVAEHGREFDAIHASPPCQGYSLGVRNAEAKATPRLIDATRELLMVQDRPWVIENVRGARRVMRATTDGYFVLCGTMFSEDVPVRHRLFETRPFLWPPGHPKCLGHNKRLAARLGVNRRMVEVATVHENVPLWRELMGMDWADALVLTLAIPPAYTEWIGRQLIATTQESEA